MIKSINELDNVGVDNSCSDSSSKNYDAMLTSFEFEKIKSKINTVDVDNSCRIITHKTYSESSYKKSDVMLTPVEFEKFERKNNKVKAVYLDRYVSYCGIIETHNMICKEICSAGYENELNAFEHLPFDDFVDCCFRGLIFSCYTYDVKTGKIYYEEKPFNKYAKNVRLKKKALFTFDPKKDFVDYSKEIAKKQKKDYDTHVEPVKLWGCMPPMSKEEEWKKEYPNIWN